MRIPVLVALIAAAAATPLLAHDFWLQPSKFWVSPGERAPIVLLVGHGAARGRSTIPQNRITLFRSNGPGGTENRMGELSLGQTADAALSFPAAGTFVVYLATNNVFSELPAPRFNEYAAAEGLAAVLSQRAASGKTGNPGRELYSRRAKTLVQVGPLSRTPQPQVTKPVGLGLEIVPMSDPYARNAPAAMTVQVLYQGRPLPGATVKLNNLAADAQPVEMHRSDAAGRATFKTPRSGQWQYNVVWSQALPNNSAADFLTTFSSLTFGFPDSRVGR